MLVKCIAVPKERTPKKVEVTLSRIIPASRNVIRLNARVAALPTVDPTTDEIFTEEFCDNLSGIVPIDEYCADSAADENLPEIFDCPETTVEDEPTVEDINADIEELENDLLSLVRSGDDDISADDINDEVYSDEAPFTYDDGIVQRHFIRDDSGELLESDSETAEGHEVACYGTDGRLKRACGVIKKGQPTSSDSNDDVFSRAVADMFTFSE